MTTAATKMAMTKTTSTSSSSSHARHHHRTLQSFEDEAAN
eukprot:CAMPEP_0119565850 /NCGR_PEP_ID=MMETSP1352-20130426/31329_1 /TAXON_ID=265584 /ORGANISM="Stauroneis constricta, Strain CCMP1120" /LENGTH=39 /DNA_ID= /DNA_START= /DNA_END= /DNA_ORIENTATION=